MAATPRPSVDRAASVNLFLRACITRTPKPTDEHHEPYTGSCGPEFGLVIGVSTATGVREGRVARLRVR